MAANSQTINTIEEAALQSYAYSLADVEAYAAHLGIDLEHERDLFGIAESGLKAPVPAPWRACQVDGVHELFYFNFETGESVWDHPSDGEYRRQVQEERAKRVHMPLTLSLQPSPESGVAVVCTNLAGDAVATVMVQDPQTATFGRMEDGLRKGLSSLAGKVPRFVLPDATLLGYSHRTRSIAQLFGI